MYNLLNVEPDGRVAFLPTYTDFTIVYRACRCRFARRFNVREMRSSQGNSDDDDGARNQTRAAPAEHKV